MSWQKTFFTAPFSCVRTIKKIFSAVLRMNLNAYINHGKAVYIIIAKAEYSLRLMRYTLRVMICALRR